MPTLDELYAEAESEPPFVDPEDDADDSDDDTEEDLYNALELLGNNLSFLEDVLKDDLQRKFLKVSQRTDLMSHCAEVMTFLDNFNYE